MFVIFCKATLHTVTDFIHKTSTYFESVLAVQLEAFSPYRINCFLAGEGPCLATYFVRRYWQLLLLRVLTGISVGGTLPLIYSLVGDLFDVRKRAPVAAAIQVATGIGLAAGQAISGFVGKFSS